MAALVAESKTESFSLASSQFSTCVDTKNKHNLNGLLTVFTTMENIHKSGIACKYFSDDTCCLTDKKLLLIGPTSGATFIIEKIHAEADADDGSDFDDDDNDDGDNDNSLVFKFDFGWFHVQFGIY